MRITDVIVPLDGSEAALGALPVARTLARALGADVTGLGVVTDESHRDRLWSKLDTVVGDVDKLVTVDGSHAADAIVGFATRGSSRLVCMSTHGRGRSAALTGSVAADVVHTLGGPLVLVGPEVPPDHELHGALVACIDGRHDPARLIDLTAAWAQALSLDPETITVAEPVPESVVPGPAYHRAHGPSSDADEYMASVVVAAASRGASVAGEAVYDPISVWSGIRSHLRERPTAMLAVATAAPTGIGRLFEGSTAAAIVRHAPVPALVLPVDESR